MSHQAETRAQNHDLVRGNNKPAQAEWVDSGKSGNKKTPNKESSKLPQTVDGVAAKDTTAKYAPLKMLPVTNAKNRGHFQNVCCSSASPTKKIRELEEYEEQEQGDEILFLGELQTTGVGWTAQLGVNGRNTCFKLDTGAAVTVVGANISWLKDQKLVKPKQTLRGPGNIKIPVIGMFLANLSYRKSKVTEPVYVIPDQACPLLSRNACVTLGLITRADEEIIDVTTQHADFKAEFPTLFTGRHGVQIRRVR